MSENEQLWHVRQYRPAYFSGFTNSVLRDVTWGQILTAPWLRNFKRDGFLHFSVNDYSGDEKIISAHYKNGEHWVAGFVLPTSSREVAPDGGLLRDNWRYQEHEC